MAATSPFGKAFAAARKAGKKTFKHNGKLYTTELREEKKPKNVPVPEKRPDTTKTASVKKKAEPEKKADLKIPVPAKRPTDEAGKANVEAANAVTRSKTDAYNEGVRAAKERHKARLAEMEKKRLQNTTASK